MNEKEYFEQNSIGQPFYDPIYNDAFVAFSDKYMKDKDSFIAFSENFYDSNIPNRKTIFGKQTFITSDSSNRRLYVWRIDLSNGILWIISGTRGRGTSYEWFSETNSYNSLFDNIIDYLYDVYNMGEL